MPRQSRSLEPQRDPKSLVLTSDKNSLKMKPQDLGYLNTFEPTEKHQSACFTHLFPSHSSTIG